MSQKSLPAIIPTDCICAGQLFTFLREHTGYRILFNAYLSTYKEKVVFDNWDLLGEVCEHLDREAPYYFFRYDHSRGDLQAPKS